MPAYRFYDTDASGFAEYDIAGVEYASLLSKCFAYCTSLSFIVRSPDVQVPEDLEQYRLPVTATVLNAHDICAECSLTADQLRHYQLSADAHACILGIADSIFKWIDGWGYQNPEDPMFHRPDGSVFFSSCIHEGYVTLHPQNGEDISDIITNPLWVRHKSS